MKVICIEDVHMDTGERVFTKDDTYHIKESTYPSGYEELPCIITMDDADEDHIIHCGELVKEGFFEKHFKLIV